MLGFVITEYATEPPGFHHGFLNTQRKTLVQRHCGSRTLGFGFESTLDRRDQFEISPDSGSVPNYGRVTLNRMKRRGTSPNAVRSR